MGSQKSFNKEQKMENQNWGFEVKMEAIFAVRSGPET